ncbi:MAG: pyrroline-5-carboxylate reductase [Rhodocyclaceae bacterium]|nr:pyrroline-5-carboxylate reductase [Rhodocyclaceae bacterium]
MKITFLGGGNMAAALMGGLKKQGFSVAGMQVVEIDADRRAWLAEAFGVRTTASVDAAALDCEALVLAVKPQQMKAALAPLAGRLAAQLVISIAAGLRLADLSRWLAGHDRLVRAMPNTPALIGAGITGLYAPPHVDREERALAERILAAVGKTLWLDDEALMDVVTALSGSGPAYVFYFLEALIEAGVSLGLPAAAARELALTTFAGASQLAQASHESLAELRARVTSKGGTTEAALAVFAANGVAKAIGEGVFAAARRGRELSRSLGETD